MSTPNAAYLAGIVDARAVLRIHRTPQTGYLSPVVRFSRTGISEPTVKAMCDMGGWASKFEVFFTNRKSVIAFLSDILPYMQRPAKIRRAEIVRQFANTANAKAGRNDRERLYKDFLRVMEEHPL